MENLIKRILDICISLPAVVILLPVFIVIVIVIRLSSKGPAVFKQERAGKNGKPFVFYKFRTMRPDVDPFGASPKSGEDPRLTKVGKFLREYSLDELPVSILEAMACGKPVIATRHRGCENIMVDGQTGFLVPIKQATALADKIGLLLDNKQLRVQMGRVSREHVEQQFEVGYCTGRIVEALEKACEK